MCTLTGSSGVLIEGMDITSSMVTRTMCTMVTDIDIHQLIAVTTNSLISTISVSSKITGITSVALDTTVVREIEMSLITVRMITDSLVRKRIEKEVTDTLTDTERV